MKRYEILYSKMNHVLLSSGLSTITKASKLRLYVSSFFIATYPVFIYTCPSHSNIKNRMIYASSRALLINEVESTLGVHVDKKIETSEVDELTIAFLKREIHGVEVEEKKAFARPRGPIKRKNLKVETSSAGASADENE
jgi:Cofilin/tropomyosin-type actin-binding protein